MERPLPYDVDVLLSPELHAFRPGIEQAGLEDMTLFFKWSPAAPHLMEAGWNGVEYAGAANCWAKNLIIVNSDNPIIIWMSSFMTVTGMTFKT